MRKAIVLAAILMILVLTACGGNKIQAQPLSARTPTAAAPVEQAPAPAPEPAPEVTAAQAIKDLQEQMQSAPATTSTGPKTATTGLPPAPEGVTGKDALIARTHALYSTGSPVSGLTGGVVTSLPDYHDESNLPEEYQQGGQYDN